MALFFFRSIFNDVTQIGLKRYKSMTIKGRGGSLFDNIRFGNGEKSERREIPKLIVLRVGRKLFFDTNPIFDWKRLN